MAAIKHIAGLILAFILGMSIMILFYELSSQSNPSTSPQCRRIPLPL